MKFTSNIFLATIAAAFVGVSGQNQAGQYTFRCGGTLYICGKKLSPDALCTQGSKGITETKQGTQAECNQMKSLLKSKGYPAVFQEKCPNGRLMTQFVQFNAVGKLGKKFDVHGSARCKGAHCGGDPHFLTYDGTGYSYHGACDLVMARSDDLNDSGFSLDIHARTKAIADWSYMSNAAIRIGTDILEITSNGTHYYNGVEGVDLNDIKIMGHYNVTRTEKEVFPKMFRIDYIIDLDHLNGLSGIEDEIRISAFKDMLSVNVDATIPDTYGMLGIMGRDGMFARDLVTPIEDVNMMGVEWQVRDDEPMLFTTVEGPQYPQQCIIPKTTDKRRLRHSEETIKKAKEACSSIMDDTMMEFCVQDILLTGDHDYAGLYHGH